LIKRRLALSIENERRAQIGLRYGPKDIDQYHRVRKIAEEIKQSLSATGKLLVAKGIQHKDNPEPLVKEKVVYKDRPVEKVVYRDRPRGIQEHITDEHIGEPHHNTGERASATKLTTRDRAGSPSSPDTALGEEKVAKEDSGLGWLVVGIAGIVGLTWWYIKGLPLR